MHLLKSHNNLKVLKHPNSAFITQKLHTMNNMDSNYYSTDLVSTCVKDICFSRHLFERHLKSHKTRPISLEREFKLSSLSKGLSSLWGRWDNYDFIRINHPFPYSSLSFPKKIHILTFNLQLVLRGRYVAYKRLQHAITFVQHTKFLLACCFYQITQDRVIKNTYS